MPFLIIVEEHNLRHVFPGPAISAGGRGEASVFSTLVLLLIQTSMFFLLSLSLLVESLPASGGREVGWLWYQRRPEFFDGVVAGVSDGGGL